MAKKRVPETRYPYNLEKAYAKRIIKMVDALGDVALTEFDKQPELFNDASISEQIKSMVNKIKGLSLGIFNEKDVAKVASSHVRAVSSASKSNVNSQVAVSGVNPIETEAWIKDYTNVKVSENVSYITNIRDEYTQKIEQTIYRGVTEGKSNAEMKEELVQQTGMAENKAKFIARDQTGTLLGQMNAERHARAGIEAFIWKDSDDGAVRATHAERDGHLYYYDDSPLLPGTEYGCRCIAKPAFEEDIEEAEANGTAVRNSNKQKPDPEQKPEQKNEVKKIDFIPITADNLGSKERISEVNDRFKSFVENYEQSTGINVLELINNNKFVDREKPYDDEKARFIHYVLDKSGYSQKPKILKNTEKMQKLHRGIVDFEDGSVTSDNQIERFINGTFDISGAKSSTYGRGLYFGTDESVAERYMEKGENGKILTVYLDGKANMLDFKTNSAEKSTFEEMKKEFGEDYIYYELLLRKGSLMDKQIDLFAIMHGYDGIKSKSVSVILNRSLLGVVE